jgi:sensor histidine kinase YesM
MDVALSGRGDAWREPSLRPTADDLWPRILLCPILGFSIPNLAGLIDHSAHTRGALLASYAFFALMAFAIYEGNRRLYFRLHTADSWLTRPWARLRLLFGTVVLYTVPLATVALAMWGFVTGDPSASWDRIVAAVLLVVLATLVIVHVYETVFVLREWASDRLRSERLQRQELETRIEALETEVDPHVLFNHLNSLSHLVEAGDARAPAFVTALAGSYRALLRTRGRRLIPLAEELDLLDEFRALTTIRLGGALRVVVSVSKDEAGRWRLPPVVLPELVENAVKHNEATCEDPLVVSISLRGDCLVLMNPIRPKSIPSPSNGVGLRNLADRFRLTTDRTISCERRDGAFRVLLPLVSSAIDAR